MGRFYSGSVEGKMWIGVQDSDDATHFGVEPTDEYSFYGCQCCSTEYLTFSEKDSTLFCESCYDSLEDHLDQTHEDRMEELTFFISNEIRYSFDMNDLLKLNKVIKHVTKVEFVGHNLGHCALMFKICLTAP